MTAVDPHLNVPRILVVSPPKSGSSYVSNVIARYFRIERDWRLPDEIDWNAEHNLTPVFTDFLRGKAFCFNLHMFPYYSNFLATQRERIVVVAVWRNLGDMFVSIDDHAFREQGHGPAFYVQNTETYLAMPRAARHLARIDIMLQWYLRFYLFWRERQMVLHPYEQMLLDRRAYFTGMLAPLLSHPVVEPMLAASVEIGDPGQERLNVGVAGRSKELLDESNKRELEARILRHPDRAQLEILLWELPWDVPALAPQSALDGQVVRTEASEQAYFVSRGRRYPITLASWLLCRVGERRVPRIIADAAELERLPLGDPLI